MSIIFLGDPTLYLSFDFLLGGFQFLVNIRLLTKVL